MDRRQFLTHTTLSAAGAAMPRIPALSAQPAMTGDLDLIRQAIALHPGALRYLDRQELDRAFARLARHWSAAPDRAARYLALTAFLATLRCGHTYCNFYNQSDAVAQDLFERRTRLPFLFRWRGGAMIVTDDLTGTGRIAPGSRIDAIDGRKPSALLAGLLPLARADGGNDAKRIAQLEVRGGERFLAFDIYQGLKYPPHRAGRFALVWTAIDGSRHDSDVPALSPAERLTAAPPPSDDGTPLWTLESRSDGVALLTMPTWVVYRSAWKWGEWLAAQAPRLYASHGVVIDIRGNEGGLSCGNPILARLAREDIVLDAFDRRVRYRRFPAALDAVVDTPVRAFRSLGDGKADRGDGFYGEPEGSRPEVIAAAAPRLTVPVAVLTDAANSSATFLFAQTIKRHGLARLFGGMTGGNLRGINAGAVGFVRLPESGIEFDLPLIGYFARGDAPDRGVEPDVAVENAPADIAAGRDRVLDTAVAWTLAGG